MAGGREIERKFLVEDAPADLASWRAEVLEQGYLAITPEVEVRIRRRPGGATLAVKSSGAALSRVEEELVLEADAFERLWPLTDGRRVTKTRHVRADGDVDLELDVYVGALEGLLTLEVEFGDEDAAGAWAPPDWVGREVTGDPAFANQTLALRGLPPAA